MLIHNGRAFEVAMAIKGDQGRAGADRQAMRRQEAQGLDHAPPQYGDSRVTPTGSVQQRGPEAVGTAKAVPEGSDTGT